MNLLGGGAVGCSDRRPFTCFHHWSELSLEERRLEQHRRNLLDWRGVHLAKEMGSLKTGHRLCHLVACAASLLRLVAKEILRGVSEKL